MPTRITTNSNGRRVGVTTTGGSNSGSGNSGGGSNRVIPISGPSAGLTESQRTNEINAQNTRWGVKPGENVTYREVSSGGGGRNTPVTRAEDIGTTPVPITDKPVTPLSMDTLASAFGGPDGFITGATGQYTPDPNASDITNATEKGIAESGTFLNSILGYLKPKEDQYLGAGEDMLGISAREAGRDLREATRLKNAATNELNAVIASRDQAMMALEDQGRGQTTGFIGGEQARINKEAAYAALPIQVRLSAAQGDYEAAKAQVDQLFSLKIKDIEADNTYRTNVGNSLMQFMNTAQTNRLNAAIADSNAKAADKTQKMQTMNEWAKMAVSTGQGVLAGKMMKLDPMSTTFAQDFASLQGQVSDPNLPLDLAYKQAQINKLNAESSGVGSDQLYSGLTGATATAVRSVSSKFGTEPLVQNFATIQEGYNFANAISNDTQNPADDQALIYAFAKAMDPGSVVREGEYATAQKYAQSWVQAYGKGVSQALAGTGFLSMDARKNIKKAIETKYESSMRSYENLQTQYSNKISGLTGRGDGANFLVDYITPALETTPPPVEEAIFNSVVGGVQSGGGSVLESANTNSQGAVSRVWNWLTGK